MFYLFSTITIVISIVGLMLFSIINGIEHKKSIVEGFNNKKEIYCLNTHKVVKGDGVFSSDKFIAFEHTKVKVVSIDEINSRLYTDKEQSFKFNDCFVK